MAYQVSDALNKLSPTLDIDTTEWAILKALADCQNQLTGLCCPSYETIAETIHSSRRTVARRLGTLQDKGIIDWVNVGRGSKYAHNEYFFKHPELQLAKPKSGSQPETHSLKDRLNGKNTSNILKKKKTVKKANATHSVALGSEDATGSVASESVSECHTVTHSAPNSIGMSNATHSVAFQDATHSVALGSETGKVSAICAESECHSEHQVSAIHAQSECQALALEQGLNLEFEPRKKQRTAECTPENRGDAFVAASSFLNQNLKATPTPTPTPKAEPKIETITIGETVFHFINGKLVKTDNLPPIEDVPAFTGLAQCSQSSMGEGNTHSVSTESL